MMPVIVLAVVAVAAWRWFDAPMHDRAMLIDGNGVFHSEWRSKWWWRRLRSRVWFDQLFERWECDMCDERVWAPRLSKHELAHTEAEWAAAGYDKAGTVKP